MKSLRYCLFGLATLLAVVNPAAAQQPRTRPLPPGVKALRDLPYVENGHERNRLDLYLPEKAPEKAEGKLPVVVWIHGGGWLNGSKDKCPAVWLTAKGFAVASINYRFSKDAVFPAQIEDCKAAIRWLRANAAKYHLDPDHIGAWGASAGGHLVAMLGTTGGVKELEGKGGNLDRSSRVQCVVDWFGPADLLTMGGGHNNPASPEAKLLGGPVQENKEKARKASPLTYVSKDSAPFLIMHGDQDNVVPPRQSEDLADALKKAGVQVKLQVVKGSGHGGPGFSTPENRRLIEEFFDKHLKGKGGAKDNAAAQKPQKPRVLVTISKETTYITGPLRKDGYVDYVAALNERCKKGVTPQNNAAVLFRQAIGPGEITPEMRARYYRMLEIQQLPEEGDYFISFDKFEQRLKEAKDPRVPKATADGKDPALDQLIQTTQRPWSKREFPMLAEWLAVNEKPLAMSVEASKRPRWYDPMICSYSDEGMVIAVLLDASNESRRVGSALAARAMLRLRNSEIDDAWNDLLACHRLARLVGQRATLVNALVAIAIELRACSGDQALLQSGKLSAVWIARIRQDVARLPPMPKMADKIDFAERYVFLDGAAAAAREGTGSTALLQGDMQIEAMKDSVFDNAVRAATDWDAILTRGNSLYDRIAAVCRAPVPSERRRDLLRIDRDLKAIAAEAKDPTVLAISLLTGNPRHAISQRIGNSLIGLYMPAVSACANAEDRGNMQAEVTRLGFALAAYRADHGSYPEQLSELAPRYVAKVPTDIFANDAPLHYKRQGKGYLLYSVGVNGRDDGGRGYNDRKNGEDWDDLSVRVP